MSKQTFRRADYYSTLDSMRFNFSRHDRTDIQRNQISAAGTVMLGLLIGDTKPVLTQAQAIDNAYVLELLAAEDSSSSGFLDLVEERTIQVRFHDRPPLIDGPHRLTLVNAFASALAYINRLLFS